MKEIKLTQGKVALVDNDMYEEINQFKWHAHKSFNTFYAERMGQTDNGKRTIIKMHHSVFGNPPKGKMTDHKDGNGLHNEKYNLRNVSNRQNCQNKKNIVKTSQYPGVCFDKRVSKWRAQAVICGIKRHIGYFVLELEAFNAYKNKIESIGEKVIG